MATTKRRATPERRPAHRRVDAFTRRIALAGLDPRRFHVGVHVLRNDGRPLTPADLEACKAALDALTAPGTTRKSAPKRAAARTSQR